MRTSDSTSFLKRLVEVQTFAWAFVVVGILVHGYLGRTWSAVQVIRVNDGWCDTNFEGVGLHCFGDFGLAYTATSTDLVYVDGNPLATGTPLTLLGFRALGLFSFSYNSALFIYLFFLAVCVFVPFFMVRNSSTFGLRLQAATLFGLISVGTIGAFDRGNHILILVPLLYGYLLAIEKGNWARATVLLIGMSLLKFWGIVFILVLIAKSKFRHAFTAVCSVVALTVLLMIPFNKPLTHSIPAMLRAVIDREYGNAVARYAFSIQSLVRRSVCYFVKEDSCNFTRQSNEWVASTYFAFVIMFVLSVFLVLIIKQSSQSPHVWMLFTASVGFLGIPEAPVYQLSLIAAPIAAVLSVNNFIVEQKWEWTTRALFVTVVITSTPLTLWSDQLTRLSSVASDGSDPIFRSDQWLVPICWIATIIVATIELMKMWRDGEAITLRNQN